MTTASTTLSMSSAWAEAYRLYEDVCILCATLLMGIGGGTGGSGAANWKGNLNYANSAFSASGQQKPFRQTELRGAPLLFPTASLFSPIVYVPSAPQKEDTRISDQPPNLDTPILPYIPLLLFITVPLFCSTKIPSTHNLLSHG